MRRKKKVLFLTDVGDYAKRIMGEERFYGRYPERWAEHLFLRFAYDAFAATPVLEGFYTLPDIVYATKDTLKTYPAVLASRIKYVMVDRKVEHMKLINIDGYLVDSLFSVPETEFVAAIDNLVKSLTKHWPNESM